MKMSVKIKIECEDEEMAEALAKAVSPDNLEAPAGMEIVSKSDEKMFITQVDFRGRIQTLVATLDDLLSCLQAAEKTLKGAKKGVGK